jgi:hypothetical protein
MTYTRLAQYIQDQHDIRRCTPQPFDNPPLLGNPYPYSLNFPFTYLESLLCVVMRFPSTLIPGWLYTDPPFPPIPFSPSPMVPHFKCMPSYDDITISTSHSPIHSLVMSSSPFTLHTFVDFPWVKFTVSSASAPEPHTEAVNSPLT